MEIKSEARLTLWEATSIIIGHSIGGGIMAVPYLASKNSVPVIVAIILLAFFFNLIYHFMIAEVSYNCGGKQIIGCLESYVFVGRFKKPLTLTAFAVFGFAMIINLSGYISGAADVLVAVFGLNYAVAKILFYIAAGTVVFFGLKAVGVSEKITVALIIAVIGGLGVASLFAEKNPMPTDIQSFNAVLALFSMVFFAMSANQSVIQAVKGLSGDTKRIRLSITLGLSIVAALVAVVTFGALSATKGEITEVGMIGWSNGLGGVAAWIGNLFTILALITTFWSISLSLRDMVSEQTGMDRTLCWLVATAPSFLMAIFNIGGFMFFTRLVSGVTMLSGFMLIAAYGISRKRAGASPICGRLGTAPFRILIVIVSILMGVGALVKV
ncbi:MAG: aromatic amino acid transport family protein [Oscillospiraceae bacterium]|nr:aromatic amino acid transport family protein [Oscillospiraceae bacterium]